MIPFSFLLLAVGIGLIVFFMDSDEQDGSSTASVTTSSAKDNDGSNVTSFSEGNEFDNIGENTSKIEPNINGSSPLSGLIPSPSITSAPLSSSPSSSPLSGAPSSPPSSSIAPSSELDLRLQKAVEIISPFSDLDDVSSMQYRALRTIVTETAYEIDIPTEPSGFPKFIQHYVIVLFYYSLGGQDWNVDTFLSGGEECFWYYATLYFFLGVGCNTDGEVRTIYLPRNNLSGTMPTELGLLTSLSLFNVEYNRIEGTIPAEISNLSELVSLRLDYNSLSGSITGDLFKFWTNIESIDASNNLLTGVIPPSLVNLQETLGGLALDDNFLIGEDINESIGRLSRLEYLYLEDNAINGTVNEDFLAALTSLRNIDLSDNELVGSFPRNFFTFDNLTVSLKHFVQTFCSK